MTLCDVIVHEVGYAAHGGSMKFVLANDAPGAQWVWELRSRATDALYARSSQRYVDRSAAVASIEAVQQIVPAALTYDEAGLLLVPRG